MIKDHEIGVCEYLLLKYQLRAPWTQIQLPVQEPWQVEADALFQLDHILRGRLATPVILATENTTCWSKVR